MGRGSGEDRALRIASLPRRLQRPQKIGQRRYRIAHQRKDKSLGGEPGYLRSVYESSKTGWDDRAMIIVEEVGVADQNGNLHWIDCDQIWGGYYKHWASVGEARDICDRLNKQPLGADLVSEVDKQGQLVIKKLRRRYSSRYQAQPQILEETEKFQAFDVTDPTQAREAKQFYISLEAEVTAEKEDAARETLRRLRDQGDERANQLFPNQEIANRSQAARKLSSDLRAG